MALAKHDFKPEKYLPGRCGAEEHLSAGHIQLCGLPESSDAHNKPTDCPVCHMPEGKCWKRYFGDVVPHVVTTERRRVLDVRRKYLVSEIARLETEKDRVDDLIAELELREQGTICGECGGRNGHSSPFCRKLDLREAIPA